jgi:nitrogen regulatory protein P-II 1
MKKIEAIIKPFKLDEVRDALFEIGIKGMTVSEVGGFDGHHDHTEYFQGRAYSNDLTPKVKLEIVLSDDEVDLAVNAILGAAKTGKIGDGKVFVTSVQDAVRIRTDESGVGAL